MNSLTIDTIEIRNLSVKYREDDVLLKDFSAMIDGKKITSIIGPEESGKSALLRAINRIHEINPKIKVTGEILFNGKDILKMNVLNVRRNIASVYSEPNLFDHLSIFDNILAGYDLTGRKLKWEKREAIVASSLADVDLFDELKDCLSESPKTLTLGQQQCVCVARAIASEPQALLLNDPTRILDGIYAKRIETAILNQKEKCTIIIETSNLSQAARLSDDTIFIKNGELIEFGETAKMFWAPEDKRTEQFITSHP